MKALITLTVHRYRLPTNNELIRMHFMEYRRLKNDLKILLGLELRDLPKDIRAKLPLSKCKVVFTRLCPRKIDWDNGAASLKPVLDLLRPLKITQGTYKTGPKAGKAYTREQGCFGVIRDDDMDNLAVEVRLEHATEHGFRIEVLEVEEPGEPGYLGGGDSTPTKGGPMGAKKSEKVVNLPGKHGNGGKAKGGEFMHEKGGKTKKGAKKGK